MKELTKFLVAPGGMLSGKHRVPGDKSISHRVLMLGAIAQGATRVQGFLEGEDTLATLAAFQAMGVDIEHPSSGKLVIRGVGLHGLQKPEKPLYLGNSGTSMRLLAGLLAGQSFDTELTGDESLSRRPMRRITEPLGLMGAKVSAAKGGMPPLKISGGQNLRGISYHQPVASAQVKSCILLAGLYAAGKTCVTEPAPSRDHTERMLSGFGHEIKRDGMKVCVERGSMLLGSGIDVPADISSAAFFMMGAAITPGSDVTLKHVGLNPTRTGIIHILEQMGASFEIGNRREISGEAVGDVRVRGSELRGIEIPREWVPLAIDEFPAIFIAAACAKGRTVLSGAEELRVKESDRIQVMADGLRTLGITVEVKRDGMIIDGGCIRGGSINSQGDHRIAMSFAMAALRAEEPIEVLDCDNVATSFPGFVELAQAAGLQITAVKP